MILFTQKMVNPKIKRVGYWLPVARKKEEWGVTANGDGVPIWSDGNVV